MTNTAKVLIIAVLTILAVVYLSTLPRSSSAPAVLSPPVCMVGITGTRATVTVEGWGAPDFCNRFVAQSSIGYLRTQPVTEPVVCEYQLGDLHITIRDQGLLLIWGNKLCQELRDRVQSGG